VSQKGCVHKEHEGGRSGVPLHHPHHRDLLWDICCTPPVPGAATRTGRPRRAPERAPMPLDPPGPKSMRSPSGGRLARARGQSSCDAEGSSHPVGASSRHPRAAKKRKFRMESLGCRTSNLRFQIESPHVSYGKKTQSPTSNISLNKLHVK